MFWFLDSPAFLLHLKLQVRLRRGDKVALDCGFNSGNSLCLTLPLYNKGFSILLLRILIALRVRIRIHVARHVRLALLLRCRGYAVCEGCMTITSSTNCVLSILSSYLLRQFRYYIVCSLLYNNGLPHYAKSTTNVQKPSMVYLWVLVLDWGYLFNLSLLPLLGQERVYRIVYRQTILCAWVSSSLQQPFNIGKAINSQNIRWRSYRLLFQRESKQRRKLCSNIDSILISIALYQ